MATYVFGYGSSAVEREKDGGFELGFGALGFSFCDIVGEAGPFAEGEVDEVVDLGFVFCNEVDAPETDEVLVVVSLGESLSLTQCHCSWWRSS